MLTWVMKLELTCATNVVMTLLGNEMYAYMGNHTELTCATNVVMTLFGNEMFANMGNETRGDMRH